MAKLIDTILIIIIAGLIFCIANSINTFFTDLKNKIIRDNKHILLYDLGYFLFLVVILLIVIVMLQKSFKNLDITRFYKY